MTMWTAGETVQALRTERAAIRRRWREEAQARLWHVEPRLFAPEGTLTQGIDAILAAMIAYYETDRAASGARPDAVAGQAADAPTAPEVQEHHPDGAQQPLPVAASPAIGNGFRYAFNMADPFVLQSAQHMAGLSLVWADIRTVVNLLATVVIQVLEARKAPSGTLDLADGFLEGIMSLIADLRVHQLEQDLAAHQEEAVVTQHLAGRFLANASHELRTPLTAVLGFAELLQEEHYGPLTPEQATAVGHIENSAQNLLEIINNMLDLLHIRAGQLKLRYRQINPRALLENLYLMLIPLASRKNVQFEMERVADLGAMEADEDIVRHIVYYLLSSALRATPEGGRVTLRAWRDNLWIGIEVQDTALHLPAEAMANMGNPFPRLENSPARGYEGWEVGLPLVHRYVDLHHGTLTVDSLPALGTVFRVELPLKRSGTQQRD